MSVENVLGQMNSSLNKMVGNIKNSEYAFVALAVVLIVFAAYIAPRLPGNIIGLFDNTIIKVLLFLIIAFTAKQNPTIGIILLVCLMVLIQTASQRKIEKKIIDVVNQAKRENMTNEINQMQNADLSIIQNMAMGPQNIGQVKEQPSILIQPQTVHQIQHETKLAPVNGGQCEQKMKYRDEFYPSYVNLQDSEYDARSNNINGVGYDDTCVSDNEGGYLESNPSDSIHAFSKTCGYSSI